MCVCMHIRCIHRSLPTTTYLDDVPARHRRRRPELRLRRHASPCLSDVVCRTWGRVSRRGVVARSGWGGGLCGPFNQRSGCVCDDAPLSFRSSDFDLRGSSAFASNGRRLRDCALIGQACAGRGFGCGVLGRRESREFNQRRRSWCWRPWLWASISISRSMQAGIARLRMHRPISTAKNAALASSRQCVLLSFDRRHQF